MPGHQIIKLLIFNAMKANPRRNIFSLVLVAILAIKVIPALCQEGTDDEGKKPVRDFFACTMIIDDQTVVNPVKGSLELIIHHRFGKIDKMSDLYGIYAPSNIRMGFTYGLTDKIMIGFGTEKNNKLQEFQLKYSILQQNRSGKMPVSVSFFGNTVIDANSKDKFGANYKFSNRFSYYGELIIARKFCDAFSAQLAPGFGHFNAVDSGITDSLGVERKYEHDIIALSFSGRYKIYNETSFMFEYDHPFNVNWIQESKEPLNAYKPNYAFGIEIGTSTHAFQVFATTFDNIIKQKNLLYNTKNFEDVCLGFNLTVRF
jgi:hypothetical protein